MSGFSKEKYTDKNYYFSCGQAYTEDHVLVYNVFVYNISRKVKQDDFIRYFEGYGEVKRAEIINKRRKGSRTGTKVGFVNFASPVVATKVLSKTNHKIGPYPVSVKASDTWRQPAPDPIVSNVTLNPNSPEESSDEEYSMEGKTILNLAQRPDQPTILQLNDDCLEHIFKLLNVRDQLQLARTCRRLCSVFQMYSKVHFRTFDMHDIELMTLWEKHDLFKMIGSSVENLIGRVKPQYNDRIVHFITTYCTNVKSVKFQSSKLRPATLNSIIDKLKNMNELELNDCNLRDSTIRSLGKATNLKKLCITESHHLLGTYLHSLRNLTELNLYACTDLTASKVARTLESLPTLRELNLQQCDRLNTHVFKTMTARCTQLEVLKISCPNVEFECIAQLPKLRHLELAANHLQLPIRSQIFSALAEHKAQQLEYLKVICKHCMTIANAEHIGRLKKLKTFICPNNDQINNECLRHIAECENLEEVIIKRGRGFSNDGLLCLVRECHKLRRLNIQMCITITETFIYKAIDILRQQEARAILNKVDHNREPLMVFAAHSGINGYIVNGTQYCEGLQYLKVYFSICHNVENSNHDLLSYLEIEDSDEYDEVYDEVYMNDDDVIDDFDFIIDEDDDEEDEFLMRQAYEFFGYMDHPYDDDYLW